MRSLVSLLPLACPIFMCLPMILMRRRKKPDASTPATRDATSTDTPAPDTAQLEVRRLKYEVEALRAELAQQDGAFPAVRARDAT